MDTFHYPVFFNCPSLNGDQKKRIEIYFKSGGVDCSSITNVNDKVYSIAFKEEEAQQRVLQRSEHVLEFEGGPLVLTVRDSLRPAGQSVSTTLDSNSSQTFQSDHETLHPSGIMNNAGPEQASNRRIVILGKSGAGKSSLANTIFTENLFMVDDTFNSGTNKCEAKSKSVNGRSITLIDTPGFFDTEKSEKELRAELVKCITECSPGPHAFLIVLKVENFTKQEQAVVDKVHQYFSEEALKYATVVFTHGDQLPEGKTIKDHVLQNEHVSDLVRKCGGRCHVIDNRYWNDNVKSEYRSNQFQVKELLKTIDKMVMKNNGRCYTNEMLQAVEEEIQQEEEDIRRSSSGNMSKEEIRQQAKANESTKLSVRLAGIGTGALLGALCGVGVMVVVAYICVERIKAFQGAAAAATAVAGGAADAAAGGAIGAAVAAGGATEVAGATGAAAAGGAIGAGATAGIVVGTCAALGAVAGGVAGYYAAEGAETPKEAAKQTAEAFKKKALTVKEMLDKLLKKMS